MEIYENVRILDQICEHSPEEVPGTSEDELHRISRSSAGTISTVPAASFATNTYTAVKREKKQHLLSAADINDLGKNALFIYYFILLSLLRMIF